MTDTETPKPLEWHLRRARAHLLAYQPGSEQHQNLLWTCDTLARMIARRDAKDSRR